MFRESGDISVGSRHCQKSLFDARDLQALRQHCIKNRRDSVMKITACSQEHFQKSFSVSTVHCDINKCRLKLSCKVAVICEHDPEMLLSSLGQSLFKIDSKWKNCSMVRWIDIWHYFLKIMEAMSSKLKRRGIVIRIVIIAKFKSLHIRWYGSH